MQLADHLSDDADADWAELERRAATEVWSMAAGRVGRTEDVASAVTFIASPRADFITGANLRVDGGFVTSVN
jgi:3-oxoacyl-[acyl-carrier protein] reductase